MKRYLVCSLLVINYANADVLKAVMGLSNSARTVQGSDAPVPTDKDTQKTVDDALAQSQEEEENLRLAMKHRAASVETVSLADLNTFSRMLEECLKAEGTCDKAKLDMLTANVQQRMTELTSKTLVARELLTTRIAQKNELKAENDTVQKGYADGKTIGAGDDEKKKILDDQYLAAVRECHTLGAKCDQNFLTQLRNEKNKYEEEWAGRAIATNAQVRQARAKIDRLVMFLTARTDIEAFAAKHEIDVPAKVKPVVELAKQESTEKKEVPSESTGSEQKKDDATDTTK